QKPAWDEALLVAVAAVAPLVSCAVVCRNDKIGPGFFGHHLFYKLVGQLPYSNAVFPVGCARGAAEIVSGVVDAHGMDDEQVGPGVSADLTGFLKNDLVGCLVSVVEVAILNVA